jgi:hypothetical protein
LLRFLTPSREYNRGRRRNDFALAMTVERGCVVYK